MSVRAYVEGLDQLVAERLAAGGELPMDREEESCERLSDIWQALSSEEQDAIEALRSQRAYRARLLDLLVARAYRRAAADEPRGTERHGRLLRIAGLIEAQQLQFWGPRWLEA